MEAIQGCVRDFGFEMNYCCFGNGSKALVVIPGLSLTPVTPMASSLKVKYRAYTTDYKVYFFDRRNCIEPGYNIEQMADDTALVMRRLGISHAHVVGHSQGGMIAQVIAAKYPHLVDRLVLCATATRHKNVDVAHIGQWKELALKGNVSDLNRDLFKHVYSPGFYNQYAELFSAMETLGTPDDLKRFVVLAQASLDFDTTPWLESIKSPTLVVGSTIDGVIDPNETVELAQALNARLVMYDNCGHAVLDESRDIHQLILDFFQQQ